MMFGDRITVQRNGQAQQKVSPAHINCCTSIVPALPMTLATASIGKSTCARPLFLHRATPHSVKMASTCSFHYYLRDLTLFPS